MLAMQDIFGLSSILPKGSDGQGGGEGDEDGDADCIVCMTEPKTTALLPCRHLCVCSDCFKQV